MSFFARLREARQMMKAAGEAGIDRTEIARLEQDFSTPGAAKAMVTQAATLNRLGQHGVLTPAILRSLDVSTNATMPGGLLPRLPGGTRAVEAHLTLTVQPHGGDPYDVTTTQVLLNTLAQRLRPGQSVSVKVDPAQPNDVILYSDEPAPTTTLHKLEQLHAEGLLTDAELDTQKAKLSPT